ncbi:MULTISPECIES: class I mannose-6-phosphate isomerase [unclassified Microbacterium]|uniref:class I mannose-6-phosphate isomerase n=1 Tax=unclassified Microbacterium TaxID=2609290 RepID=UPI00300F7F9D
MTTPINDMHDGHTVRGRYDTQPTVPLPPGERILRGPEGWRAAAAIAEERARAAGTFPVLLVDAYPGADVVAVTARIRAALPDWTVRDVEEAAHPVADVERLIAPNLTDDRVFGVMSHFTLADFYDDAALAALAAELRGPTVVVGWGAGLLVPHLAGPSALVLVDMARWEIQLRQRAGATNWRADNPGEDNLRKYKRGFFVEWRVADRHKRDLFDIVDVVVDGNAIAPAEPHPDAPEAGMITGDAFRGALRDAAARPFRVVPFFDPGVWGGQWMKNLIGLDPSKDNYAWCFDCVPEENSLLLQGDGGVVEIPALDLVFSRPVELLGAKTFARFGAEFPIRFDFLDTMDGGNLSLQVHPLTDYIQNTFGMHYTQDESYYMLDAGDDAVVYLGTKEGVDRDAMLRDLATAQDGEHPFPADEYVNAFPAHKHDHFAIPAGTVHCSGANSMVLEISATPFIFTFKLWDWGRVGLDGVPRPVHLDHGARNIQWDRDTAWVTENLIDRVETVRSDDDVVEESTGLHELEFIEVRRHWFRQGADHDTEGTVNVLNLVEGDEVRVVSPTGAFAPFVVHYAETFIVPAAVGRYRIERTEHSRSARFATVKAFVRGTAMTGPETARAGTTDN